MGQGKQGQSQVKQFEQLNDLLEVMYKNLLKNQTKYEKNVSKMTKSQKKEMKARIKQDQKNYKLTLKQMKKVYKDNQKQMTKADKQAYKLIYTQRKKDFKKLLKMSEDTFEDMGEALEEEFEDAIEANQDKWDAFAENLSNLAVTMSVTDELTDALEDETKSLNELKNSIIKNTSITQEQLNDLINNDFKKIVDEFDGLFSMEDALEVVSELGKMGINNPEELKGMLPDVLTIQASFDDVSMDQLDKMVQAESQLGVDMAHYANQFQALKDSGLEVKTDDLFDVFNENYDTIYKASNGDPEEFDRRMGELLKTTAVLSDSWGDTEGLMEFLNEMKDLDPTQYADYAEVTSLLGVTPQQLQQMMKSGEIDDAMMAVIQGVQGAYSKNMGPELEQWLTNQFKDVNIDKLKTLDVATLDQQMATAEEALDLSDTHDFLQETVEDTIVSPITKALNKFKNSPIGLWLSQLSSDTGIDMGDIFMGNAMLGNPLGKGVGKLGKGLWGGAKGLLGKIPGIGSLFGGGAGATATTAGAGAGAGGAGATAGGAGLLSTLGGWFSGVSGMLGSTAAAGSATAIGVGAGSVAGGLGGLAGIISGGIDFFKSFKEDDEEKKSELRWQGGSKVGMVGAGAATGAAIGSVVPVVGTAAGALIGAGVGGLGAIFGGDGVGSWLKDKWDDGSLKDAGKSALASMFLGPMGGAFTAGTDLFKKGWNWLWGKDQDKSAEDSVNAQGEMELASESLGDTSDSVFDAMMKKLKSLAKTAKDTSSTYNQSMNQMEKQTVDTGNSNVNDGDSSNSGGGGSDKKFTWWNPFTWFNGSHKDGLDYVPFDGYIAQLHKGETVLTAEEADIWRKAMKAQGESRLNLHPREEFTGNRLPSLSLDDGAVIEKDNTVAELHQGEAVLTRDQSRTWFADATGWFKNLSAKFKEQAQEAMQKFWEIQRTPVSSGGDQGGDGSTPDIGNIGDTAEAVWKFFTGSSYSKQATAGIMGNLQQESGLNPSIKQSGGGPGRGIAQWTVGSDRFQGLESHAKSKGKEWTDLQSQLEWIDKELNGADPTTKSKMDKHFGGLAKFKQATDINWAVKAFEESFERAGKPMWEKRYSYAQQFYDKFNAYEQGTPWVPDTQVALLHKGEMVVPADENPINKITRSGESGEATVSVDNSDIVNVIKWAVHRIESKLDEGSKSGNVTNNTVYNMNKPTTSTTTNNVRGVFRF